MRSIQLVSINEKEKLRKYFLDYLVELSRFDPTIIMDDQGTPIYKWYDCYWQERGRYPFLFSIDGRFVGLALVRELEPKHHEIAEFYVLPEFRKDNNALDFATRITELFGGRFSFSTRSENIRAVKFWNKFVLKFSHGGSSVDEHYTKWFIETENSTNFS